MIGRADGVKITDAAQVAPMFARKDIAYTENTDKPEYLRKYGESAGSTLMNVVTRDNKNNPKAYILAYQHLDDPLKTL
jgi:hypothetical protein